MEEEEPPKRRRVTQACENCRALKSKCDGKQPVCGRCKGYGYTCRWRARRGGSAASNLQSSNETDNIVAFENAALRDALENAHGVLRRVHDKLPSQDQRSVEAILSDASLSPKSASISSPLSENAKVELLASYASRRPSTSAHRYLGEVSDVSFFNSVKKVLQRNATDSVSGPQLESYEREHVELSETEDRFPELPSRKVADSLLEIYFTTIHVAYPFICRQQFMKDYETFWAQHTTPIAASAFSSLLLTILAIGSQYSVCTLSTAQSGTSEHSSYFRRAVVLYCQLGTEHSIENVCILLAQAFYLLATCQTDRCWTTLGLAIRTAQSIGLHVEEGRSQPSGKLSQITQEFRRRTWYSLYVLDRLLALQLGRPSAIRNRDFVLEMPSRMDDLTFDLMSDFIPDSVSPNEPQSGDYFNAVIRFSVVIGHVMRDIYRPSMIDYSEAMLSRTDQLDAEILNWKAQLPRWLRFDRGHTFERSAVLKKQRNMLGIKFHHLRALIHRPYLCLPWLQHNDSNIKCLLDLHSRQVVHSESICVREAQETAHMLHDVTDKKSLVEDFPWWQMISCLICASSILLVMRAFVSPSTDDDNSRELLEEDANTCLKVFDALSTNSEAARSARDMLQNLREIRTHNQTIPEVDTMPSIGVEKHQHTADVVAEPKDSRARLPQPTSTNETGNYMENDLTESNGHFVPASTWSWPSEIADSMAWSFQFVDTLDPQVLNAEYT